jgi:hypothetical protein
MTKLENPSSLTLSGHPRIMPHLPKSAADVSAELHAKYCEIPDRGTWNAYDHLLVCHGCGSIHVERTAFLGGALSIGFKMRDGSVLVLPALACKDCAGHEVIRRAFHQGMPVTAQRSAMCEIGNVRNDDEDGEKVLASAHQYIRSCYHGSNFYGPVVKSSDPWEVYNAALHVLEDASSGSGGKLGRN